MRRAHASWAWGWLLICGCARAPAASFVPVVELQLRAQSSSDRLWGDPMRSGQRRPWSADVVAWLRFEPRAAASAVPTRAELAPETWLAPCDTDDIGCLREAGESESEIARALGELE